MKKCVVGAILVVLAFAIPAVAAEEGVAAKPSMIDSGNILLLIYGSPNFSMGYDSIKVDPDEGDSQDGSNLSFTIGGRAGFFIMHSFAIGVHGSLGYKSEEVAVTDEGVTIADNAVTTTSIGLGPWIGYFADLKSWFIPYIGLEAGLEYTSTDIPDTAVTTELALGMNLIAGALFNFAGKWALDLEIDWGEFDQGVAVGLAFAF